MPTYEYKCDACGNAFEKFQSMSAAPIKKCPKCGKNKVRRLISTGAGLIFKGSGFYITDYRSEGYKSAAKSETGGGESKGGDSKPAESKPSESTPAAPAAAPAASAPAESKPAKSKKK